MQWRGALPSSTSLDDRKAGLHQRLKTATADIANLSLDWDSVSMAAQTVQGVIDADQADRTIADLERRGLRVDRIVDRQIVNGT